MIDTKLAERLAEAKAMASAGGTFTALRAIDAYAAAAQAEIERLQKRELLTQIATQQLTASRDEYHRELGEVGQALENALHPNSPPRLVLPGGMLRLAQEAVAEIERLNMTLEAAQGALRDSLKQVGDYCKGVERLQQRVAELEKDLAHAKAEALEGAARGYRDRWRDAPPDIINLLRVSIELDQLAQAERAKEVRDGQH